MAKGQKNKQQNEPFAEMMARLVAEKATKPVVASREDRKYFLIVSEGTQTEKLYAAHFLSPPKVLSDAR
jgi:hypothetical protein